MMISTAQLKDQLEQGAYYHRISEIYSCDQQEAAGYARRYLYTLKGFVDSFGESSDVRMFTAPGRTEIGGNHTDHQHGCVIAAGVNLDVMAVASPSDSGMIKIQSEGYPIDLVDLTDLSPKPEEKGKSVSLIRGIAAKLTQMGYSLQGVHAYTTSSVLKGSGLSSSAAFEVLIGVMLNCIYCENKLTATEIAQIGQYAENVFFDKPCGLMDQMASSTGGVISIDFADNANPIVEKVYLDLQENGYALCIIDSSGDHTDLTEEYASITIEMKAVAHYFNKQYLSEVQPAQFLASIPALRKKCSDRAVLRAIHFFEEDARVAKQVKAIKDKNFQQFLQLVNQSGHSSFEYLQNVYVSANTQSQPLSIVLAICQLLLGDKGAFRIHGGGFAGTAQAFVPLSMVEQFKSRMEAAIGEGKCHILSIRPFGGTQV